MTLALIASIIAFGSYSGLLVLLFRAGLQDRIRRLFFSYLLVMMLIQVTYLGVSLAGDEQSALFWYIFNIPLSLGQMGIFFFFTRTFLGKDTPKILFGSSVTFWMVIVIICFTFRPYVIPDIYRDPSTGLFVPEIGNFALVLSIPVLIVLGATTVELIRGYQGSFRLQKTRIQYLLLAIVIVWAGMFANGSSVLRAYPVDVTANIFSAILITLAILRYQLLDMNIVARKGLVYSVSVLIMGFGYFTVIFLLTHIFVIDQSNSLLLSIVAAVVVVGVLTPLRDRIQSMIDHALFREKYDGLAMIQRLSNTTASILDLEKLSRTILNDVTETMHLEWAVLSLKRGNDFAPIAIKGLGNYQCVLDENHPVLHSLANTSAVVTANDFYELLIQGVLSESQFDELANNNIQMIVPLRTHDDLVGVIVLGPKLSEQVYSPDDEMVLATLANQVAVAVDNARLYETVQSELMEREKLIAQLKGKNSELESFTYTVSHDLKAPLLTINGFLEYLQKDALAGNTERIKNDISRITEATEKMDRLLAELLELSRIGRMMNAPEEISFGDLIKDALEIVHGQLERHNITVHSHPNLPPVRGDRQRLTEVLQNLIDNAAKYMGDQTEPLIEIGQQGDEDGKPVFFVRDNGIGIEPEFHERVFDLFSKLDPKSDGTGIGLALIHRIIEVHGGRIWVESEPGEGSTFYFTLPQG